MILDLLETLEDPLEFSLQELSANCQKYEALL